MSDIDKIIAKFNDWERLNAENAEMRIVLDSAAVYTAIRHYQKQGLCEGNEYDELEQAIDLIAKLGGTNP